ncbi:hypothetical protein EBZ37_05830 [bacterium]|nr:hypothetical protein [bacterium]
MAEEEALETGREPVNDIYERPPKLPAPLSVTLRELQETYVNPGLGDGHKYIGFEPWTAWSRFFNFGGVKVHVALFDRLPGAEQGSGANELDFRLTPFQHQEKERRESLLRQTTDPSKAYYVREKPYYTTSSCLIKDRELRQGGGCPGYSLKTLVVDGQDQTPEALADQHRSWVQKNRAFPGCIHGFAPMFVYNADKVKWDVMEEQLSPWLRGDLDLKGEPNSYGTTTASIFLLASRSWPELNLASTVYSVRDYRGLPKRFRLEKRLEQPGPDSMIQTRGGPRRRLRGEPPPEPAEITIMIDDASSQEVVVERRVKDYYGRFQIDELTADAPSIKTEDVKDSLDMQRHMLSQAQAAWAAGACSLNEEARTLPQMTWKTMDALGKLQSSLTQAWQEAQTLHASVQRHVQSASSQAPPPKRARRSHPYDWWPDAAPASAPSE